MPDVPSTPPSLSNSPAPRSVLNPLSTSSTSPLSSPSSPSHEQPNIPTIPLVEATLTEAEPVEWELDIYDLFSQQTTLKITRDPTSMSPALDFMHHGYITKTTKAPGIAIAIRTLELLYRLRQRRASFSIEAFVKVVCDYYEVCYCDVF